MLQILMSFREGHKQEESNKDSASVIGGSGEIFLFS